MKILRIWLASLIALVAWGMAQAETVAPSLAQFDYVAPVVDGQESLRKFEVPFDVLMHVRHPSRRDVQVFDAQGHPMPTKLSGAGRESATLTQDRTLSFFPVMRDADAAGVRYSFQFSSDAETTAINLSAPHGDGPGEVQDYVVRVDRESNKSLGNLVRLQLEWAQSDANVIAPIRVEGSSDLESWQALSDGAVISDLRHDGVTLIKNDIDLKAFAGKYLRVTWPAAESQLALEKITGTFSKQQTTTQAWRHASIACRTETPRECEFATGAVPVKVLRVEDSRGDYFLQATLYSRAGDDRNWVRRTALQQYRLLFDDAVVSQAQNTFPQTTDAYWKLTYSATSPTPLPDSVEVRWRPLYVAFVAQGEPPYQVAFGSAEPVPSSSRMVDTVLRRGKRTLAAIELVPLGPVAENDVTAPFWTRERIETYALWSVLVIAVAIMLWIALGLFRRMESTTP